MGLFDNFNKGKNECIAKNQTDYYAKVYVATAAELGIIKGTNSDGSLKFKSQGNTTRAEAAVVIYRMLDNG